jgi:IS1 family transposase
MARFVQKQANKQWVWSAMDAQTRPGIAWPGGERSRTSATGLWAKMPAVGRQPATFYPDPYVV